MFGLVMIAMLTAIGLISVSSASATQSTGLCNEHLIGLGCPTAQLTTSIHATASEPLIHTSTVNVKCSSSLLKVSVLGLGNPQVAHLEELTWTGCKTHGGTNCTLSTVLKGLFNILKLSTTDAHVKSTGGTVTLVVCGVFIHCSYGGEPAWLASGSPAVLHVNSALTESEDPDHESAICPSTSTLLALYASLANAYIRS
jgi:hypothetical protein